MHYFNTTLLPTDIIFHPSWWNKHTGIVFDEDFFYHPLRRVEDEKRMERELYDRFGSYGLGAEWKQDRPEIGAVYLAAGFLLSEMLGCEITYFPDTAPQVNCAHRDSFEIDEEAAFKGPAFKRLLSLIKALENKYGYVCGDINWGGILNLAIDLKGEAVLMDMILQPEACKKYFTSIARVVERFFSFIVSKTGSSSISVNRVLKHIQKQVYLHSECSHTMISEEDYENFLLPYDIEWSLRYRPYGIHYCGNDPHRHAGKFAEIPHLDFLDAGWGGDIPALRKALPDTFINVRLNPVDLNSYSNSELETMIETKVRESGDLLKTGVCCINMDDKTEDEKVHTIFRTVERLRRE